MSISWPIDTDYLKICFHMTGAYGSDAKCNEFCVTRYKTKGSCKNKRCVCNIGNNGNNAQSNEDESKEAKPPFNFFAKPKSALSCATTCRLNCKNKGKSNGSCIAGVCMCSTS